MDGYPFVSGYLRGVAGTISSRSGTHIIWKLDYLKNRQNFSISLDCSISCLGKSYCWEQYKNPRLPHFEEVVTKSKTELTSQSPYTCLKNRPAFQGKLFAQPGTHTQTLSLSFFLSLLITSAQVRCDFYLYVLAGLLVTNIFTSRAETNHSATVNQKWFSWTHLREF